MLQVSSEDGRYPALLELEKAITDWFATLDGNFAKAKPLDIKSQAYSLSLEADMFSWVRRKSASMKTGERLSHRVIDVLRVFLDNKPSMPAMSRPMHWHKKSSKLRLKRRNFRSCTATVARVAGSSSSTATGSTATVAKVAGSSSSTATGSTSYFIQVTGTNQRILPSGQVGEMEAVAPAAITSTPPRTSVPSTSKAVTWRSRRGLRIDKVCKPWRPLGVGQDMKLLGEVSAKQSSKHQHIVEGIKTANCTRDCAHCEPVLNCKLYKILCTL
eukprot:6459878-Amphidinium_carterae.1